MHVQNPSYYSSLIAIDNASSSNPTKCTMTKIPPFLIDIRSYLRMLTESYYHDTRYPVCTLSLPQIWEKYCSENTTTTFTWPQPYEKLTAQQVYNQVRQCIIGAQCWVIIIFCAWQSK